MYAHVQNYQKSLKTVHFRSKMAIWAVILVVIDLKYFVNFYGALSLYFWAFEPTLESEYTFLLKMQISISGMF